MRIRAEGAVTLLLHCKKRKAAFKSELVVNLTEIVTLFTKPRIFKADFVCLIF